MSLKRNFMSRVPDHNSVSLLYIMLEIHQSDREPSIFSRVSVQETVKHCVKYIQKGSHLSLPATCTGFSHRWICFDNLTAAVRQKGGIGFLLLLLFVLFWLCFFFVFTHTSPPPPPPPRLPPPPLRDLYSYFTAVC